MIVQLLFTGLLGLLSHSNEQDATYGDGCKSGHKEIYVCGTRNQLLKETTCKQQLYYHLIMTF